jgi:hypothetical protein
MPQTVRGTDLARERIELVFDPATGDAYQETWSGTKAAIEAKHALMRAAGYKSRISNNGHRWECVVTIGNDGSGGSETPLDKWSVSYEWPQISIFNLPQAAKEADSYIDRAQYRLDIEEAVKNGVECPLDPGNFPFAHHLHRMLSRGTEAYEVRRPLLKRSRTFSTAYATRALLTPLEYVYKTSVMDDWFGVPAVIMAQLPADPGTNMTPAGTTWGWRVKGDESDTIPFLNRIEEVKTWIFAAWDTDLHTIVSTPP